MKRLFIILITLSAGYLAGYWVGAHNTPTPEPSAPVLCDTLTDWQVMQMALVMTESGFDSTAVSERNAYGVLQLTPVYVAEANRLGGDYTHGDALSLADSFAMFCLVQSEHNPGQDIDVAIRQHNPTAGSWYLRRVKANMEKVRTAEKVRTLIKITQ